MVKTPKDRVGGGRFFLFFTIAAVVLVAAPLPGAAQAELAAAERAMERESAAGLGSAIERLGELEPTIAAAVARLERVPSATTEHDRALRRARAVERRIAYLARNLKAARRHQRQTRTDDALWALRQADFVSQIGILEARLANVLRLEEAALAARYRETESLPPTWTAGPAAASAAATRLGAPGGFRPDAATPGGAPPPGAGQLGGAIAVEAARLAASLAAPQPAFAGSARSLRSLLRRVESQLDEDETKDGRGRPYVRARLAELRLLVAELHRQRPGVAYLDRERRRHAERRAANLLKLLTQAVRTPAVATAAQDDAALVPPGGPAGAISGTVTEDGTGNPILDVAVDIFDTGGSFVSYAYSDAVGSYTVSMLADGTYYAVAVDGGVYLSELYDNIPCASGCDPTTGTPIPVTGGGTTSGIDFALVEGGKITGTVTVDGSGTPLAGIFVFVYDASGSFTGLSSTGGDGIYTVGGLPAGNYFVRVVDTSHTYIEELYDNIPCPGFCDVTTGTPVGVASTTSGIDFALAVGASIAGTITEDGTGTPIMDVEVDIYDASGNNFSYAYSDATGSYSAGGLPSGTYTARTFDFSGGGYLDELYNDIPCSGFCDVTTGTPISATVPAATPGIDFALVEGGAISGTVTEEGSGTSVSGISVWVFDSLGFFIDSRSTLPDGTYEIDGLPAGNYFVRTRDFSQVYIDEVYDNIPCPGFCDVTTGTPVAVAAMTTATGVDFALAVAGTISGTVTELATGTPLADIEVDIFDASGSLVSYAYTDATGAYTAAGVTTGNFFATTFGGGDLGLIDELYNDIPCPNSLCDPTTGTPIAATLGADTLGIDFALAEGGAIAGTVTEDPSGTPLGGIFIQVYDSGGSFAGSDFTASDGTYEVGGLLSGSYFVRARDFSNTYIEELYDNIPCISFCNPTTGTPVAVASTTTGIDFALAEGGAIAGTVTEEGSGTPLPNISVWIYSSSGSFVKGVGTASDGTYEVGGLLSGSYFVRTRDFSNTYITELYDNIPCPSFCDVTTGTPVAVASTTSGIDFALALGGSVSGTVTEDGSGAPIADIDVDIYDSSGSFISYGYSDASGSYSAGGLPTGTFFARTFDFSGRGFLAELYDDLPCVGFCDVTAGTPIGVTAGADTGGIDFALVEGGSVSGTVTEDGTGTPLDDIEVDIFDGGGNFVSYAYSDATGSYTVPSLPGGTFFAIAFDFSGGGFLDELYDDLPCAGGCDPTTGTPIAVTPPGDTGGIDFALAKGGAIAGTVTEEGSGTPIEGLFVRVWDSGGAFVDGDSTASDGTYEVGGLLPGTHFVDVLDFSYTYIQELYDNIPCPGSCDVTTGTPVAVGAGSTTSGIDFALPVGASISGTVTEDGSGTPIADLEVSIYDSGGDFISYSYTDATGSYSAGGLPTGTFFARTFSFSGVNFVDELYDDIPCPFGCFPPTGTGIAVTAPADTGGINFALTPGASFAGSIKEAATGGFINFVFVNLYDASGSFLDSFFSFNGTYAADGLPAGTYFAATSNTPGFLSDQLWDGFACPGGPFGFTGCYPPVGTPIVLSPGTMLTGLDFLLAGPPAFVPADLDLSFETVMDPRVFRARLTIAAGPDFEVVAPGDATFRTMEEIAFRNGFSIDTGGLFTAGLDLPEVQLGQLIDPLDAGLPAHIDVLALTVFLLDGEFLRFEFELRGPPLPESDPQLDSLFYRVFADLEAPFLTGPDFGDQEFAWEGFGQSDLTYATRGPVSGPDFEISGNTLSLTVHRDALGVKSQFAFFADVVDFDAAGTPFDQTTGLTINLP